MAGLAVTERENLRAQGQRHRGPRGRAHRARGAHLLPADVQPPRGRVGDAGVEHVEGADEARHERRLREVVDLEGRPDLLDPALAHHDDPVRQRERLFLVVRDIDRGDPERSLDGPDLRAEADPDLRVQGGERLVEEQHLGLEGERARQGDALLLSARHLPRVAVARARQADELEQLRRSFRDRGLVALANLQPESDVVGDGHVREQRVCLEDHADVPAVGRPVGDVRPVEDDAARRWVLEARDHAQGRGLATARRPQEGDELALLHREVEVRDGHEPVGEPFLDAGEGQVAHARAVSVVVMF